MQVKPRAKAVQFKEGTDFSEKVKVQQSKAVHPSNIPNSYVRPNMESVGNTPFIRSTLKKKAIEVGLSQMEAPAPPEQLEHRSQ